MKRRNYIKKRTFPRVCRNCQEPFTAYRKKDCFCSPECSSEKKRIDHKRKVQRKKKCQFCEEKFLPTRSNQSFCSVACRIIKEKSHCYPSQYSSVKLVYWQVLNRDNFQCQYCGKTPTRDGIRLHLDHIKPSMDGGKTEINNLVTACEECNLSKSATPLRYEADFKKRLKNKNTPVDTQKSFDFLLGREKS